MVNCLKYIDKFLKFLHTDRNTFLTYILSLATAYIVVDRIVDFLIILFTGMAGNYWGPIQYTLALACPVFAFLFSFASKYAKSDESKLTLLYSYMIAFTIIFASMITQFINQFLWIGLFSIPNAVNIIKTFPELIHPAFSSLAIYIPILMSVTLFDIIHNTINDSKDLRDSVADYGGISLAEKNTGTGPFTCEMFFGNDKKTGQVVKIPEIKRFDGSLVIGVSGSGKTSLIFEPFMARHMDKKYFFKETAKEMGYTALRTGIANLKCPYGNEYINQNFTLDMLTPNPNKINIYKTYMKKMILAQSGDKFIYKNLGITSLSPDYESTSHMLEVAKCFNFNVNLIDPNNPDSPGINPFIYEEPQAAAIAISTVLRGLTSSSKKDSEQSFRDEISIQAVENLSILLREMYPRLHGGDLPTLEDILNCLNDFSLVEDMCEQMKEIPELKEKYNILLGYFKKNFYSDGISKNDTEKYVISAISQLDSLLRHQGVKNILCNRTNNLNFDNALANGEITLVCTRRGDLGAPAHKAFGLFFLLLMQFSVLRRPGNEKNRIPHFLYIDEFADYICDATESIFTLYRKYRVAPIISAQNLDQLGSGDKKKYKQTILANSENKFVFGNNTPEDNEWWSIELGEKREWIWNDSYETSKGRYDPKLMGIKYGWKKNYQPGKVQSLKFKSCMYKIRTVAGKSIIGTCKLDFLDSKYKEPKNPKNYNFEKFTNGISDDIKPKKKKMKITNTTFDVDDKGDLDPIKTDTTDSKFLLENDDAVIFDLKKGNSN